MVSQNSAVRRISYHGDAKSEQIRLRNTDKHKDSPKALLNCARH